MSYGRVGGFPMDRRIAGVPRPAQYDFAFNCIQPLAVEFIHKNAFNAKANVPYFLRFVAGTR